MILTEKQIKILSSTKWYHATTKENYENIRKVGVQSEYNKGNELDFGYGFYLMPSEKLAENYLTRLFGKFDRVAETMVIIEFTFCPLDWFSSDEYSTMIFKKFDDEFANFVFTNRLECQSNKQRHNYDAIYGVMSDSIPTKLLLDYKSGDISKDEVLEGLKKETSMKQLSLHNQSLCDSIVLTRAYEFNPQNQERKELDINE